MARRTRMPHSRQLDSPEDEARREELFIAFGAKLRVARRKAGLTQKELADATGISQSYIFEMETMGTNISLEGLAKVATSLKISIKDLIPENEFEPGYPSSIAALCSILERVAETLGPASELLSEVRSFAELRERLEREAKDEPKPPEQFEPQP